MSGDVRLPFPGAALERDAPLPLSLESAHYLTRVRRLGEGDRVVVFDGAGRERPASLSRDAQGAWWARLDGELRVGQSGAAVTLCLALPKGDKLEQVVRQATELGVGALHLIAGDRSVSRWDADRGARRLDRLKRIAEEAARQCGRADTPALLGPDSLADALPPLATRGAVLLFAPTANLSLDDWPAATPCSLCVGPEGGFSDAERSVAASCGAQEIRLVGPILRAETAAVVATALVLHRVGAL